MNEFLIGLVMAIIDSVILPLIKYINEMKIGIKWMVIPTIVYAIQPWLFKYSLNFSSLTIMNLVWDVLSDLLVTMIGLFIMKETLNMYQIVGVCSAFMSIIFFGVGRNVV